MLDVKSILAVALEAAVKEVYGLESAPEILSTPDPKLGDFSTNIAMQLAREVKKAPRQVAESLVAALGLPEGLLDRLELAGPGFINFYIAQTHYAQGLQEVLAAPEQFGRSSANAGKRANVEYVSANPTGPVHMGNARGGAVGDALCNLLEATGWQVDREYYINDAWDGTQMTMLGQSVQARYRQLLGQEVEFPEKGYQGDYITELAQQLLEEHGPGLLDLPEAECHRRFQELSRKTLVDQQVIDLSAFGINFDRWYREQSLYDEGALEVVVDRLKASGWTYELDGALWLKSTHFGDDKDRVLVRQDGRPAYIAADLAYHMDKFERGYDLLVDVWGPHHHGYTQRVEAGIAALGFEAAKLHFLIYQIVRLFDGGEMVKMSKRAGDLVSMASVLEDIGADATRFFFLMRAADSHLDFDLALARKQSDENPVYYVQYAHARLCSLEKEAGNRGIAIEEATLEQLSLLREPSELALMKLLLELPILIEDATRLFTPHRLTHYSLAVADAFHRFYQQCPILPAEPELRTGRFGLARATKAVLRQVLALIGVSAPEQM